MITVDRWQTYTDQTGYDVKSDTGTSLVVTPAPHKKSRTFEVWNTLDTLHRADSETDAIRWAIARLERQRQRITGI